MANETTLTTLTELKLKATMEGLYWAATKDVWLPIINHVSSPLGVSTHIVPVITAPTAASAAGEATAQTAQELDSGVASEISLVELVKSIKITNHVIIQIPNATVSDRARFLAEGITKGISAQCVTAASTWSQTVSAAGTPMATSHFESALAQIRAAGSQDIINFVSGAVAIYGPKGITTKLYGLSSNEYALASGTNVDDFSKTGFVSRTYGMNVYLDPAIEDDELDDIKGYFFSRDAMVYATQRSFMIDADYIADTRVTNLIATYWGGAKEKIDGFGVIGTFDVS